MPVSLQAFILIFVAGAALRTLGVLTKAHAERLAGFVFCVTLPATIVLSLDGVTFAPTAWKLPLAAWMITCPIVGLAWILARSWELPRPAQGGFMLATGCINSVYFAYPVILATLGEAGLARAVLFDLGQTALTLTGLYAIAVWHGQTDEAPRSVLRRLLLTPPLWALAAILVVKAVGVSLAPWVRDVLTPLHLCTTPLASLVLGLSMTFTALRRTVWLALAGVMLRMGGGLTIGWLVVSLLELTDMARLVVLLIAGMPSAVTAVIFASETRLDEDLVASIVALSICVGVAVLPGLPSLVTWLNG
ncbi:transporter [Nitrospira sp.]|nr:transporter [Nitrospira sp.]